MSNQIDDFADFLAGITPEERATLSGLRDGTLVAVQRGDLEMLSLSADTTRADLSALADAVDGARDRLRAMLAAAPEAPGRG